jgi:hypothetical protein
MLASGRPDSLTSFSERRIWFPAWRALAHTLC